jgi:hypothetical protein
MPGPRILTEYVPLLREALMAHAEPKVRQVGAEGEIEFLVEYDVSADELSILDQLIGAISANYRPGTAHRLQSLVDALRPHLGKKLLRASMQCAARRHEIYVDPVARKIVHLLWGEVPHNQAPNFDPADRSTWLNMHLDWAKTVDDDPAYREWLESTLFPIPDEFFNPAAFEASRTLYSYKLQDSLLEDAVYRGIPRAPFQKTELNDAVRDASAELFGHIRAEWFHVNVHDNVARFVEKFGRYSFDYPLVPVYVLLVHHQALEGGTTYAGIASAEREWVLLFEDGFHISVHGPLRFVDRVCEILGVKDDG